MGGDKAAGEGAEQDDAAFVPGDAAVVDEQGDGDQGDDGGNQQFEAVHGVDVAVSGQGQVAEGDDAQPGVEEAAVDADAEQKQQQEQAADGGGVAVFAGQLFECAVELAAEDE